MVAGEATRVGVKRKEENKKEKIQVTSIKSKRLNAFLSNTKFTCFGEQSVARGSAPPLCAYPFWPFSPSRLAYGLRHPRPSRFELKRSNS